MISSQNWTRTIQMVRAFLVAALYEGTRVVELGKKAGVVQTVISRHIGDLGATERDKKLMSSPAGDRA